MSSNNKSLIREMLEECANPKIDLQDFINTNIFESMFNINPNLVYNNYPTSSLAIKTTSFQNFKESFLDHPFNEITKNPELEEQIAANIKSMHGLLKSKQTKETAKKELVENISAYINHALTSYTQSQYLTSQNTDELLKTKSLLLDDNNNPKLQRINIEKVSDIIPAIIALASEIKINAPHNNDYYKTNDGSKLIRDVEKVLSAVIVNLTDSNKQILRDFEEEYLYVNPFTKKNEKSITSSENNIANYQSKVKDFALSIVGDIENEDFNNNFDKFISANSTRNQLSVNSNDHNVRVPLAKYYIDGKPNFLFDNMSTAIEGKELENALQDLSKSTPDNFHNRNLRTILQKISKVGNIDFEKSSNGETLIGIYALLDLIADFVPKEYKFKVRESDKLISIPIESIIAISFGDIINDIRDNGYAKADSLENSNDYYYNKGKALADLIRQREAERINKAQANNSQNTVHFISAPVEEQSNEQLAIAENLEEEEDFSDVINISEEDKNEAENSLNENKKQLTAEEKKNKLISTRKNFLDKLLGKLGDISSEAQTKIDTLNESNTDPAISKETEKNNKKEIKKATKTQTAISRLKGRIDPYKFYCIRKSVEITNSTENKDKLISKIQREIRLGENPQKLTDAENSDNNRTPMPKTISLLVDILQNVTANRTSEKMLTALITSAKKEINLYDEYLKYIKKNKLENTSNEYYSFVQQKQSSIQKDSKKDLGKPAGKAVEKQEQSADNEVQSATEKVEEKPVEQVKNKANEQEIEKEVASAVVEEKVEKKPEQPTETSTSNSEESEQQ
jgi:hypothetical protein